MGIVQVDNDSSYSRYYRSQIADHLSWLHDRGEIWRVQRWELLLASQPEPAICEAMVRSFLASHVEQVWPNESRSAGGPDYLCIRGDAKFYVEATCLLTAAVTEETELMPGGGPRHYRRLTAKFKAECVQKAGQCANLDAPCLLAICTLHGPASALCFGKHDAAFVLTSEPQITVDFDTDRSEAVGGFPGKGLPPGSVENLTRI